MDSDLVVKQIQELTEDVPVDTSGEVKKVEALEPDVVTPLQEYYGIEEPDNRQKEQLTVVWDYFRSRAESRGDALKQLRDMQLTMVQPEVGQTRLQQLYNYIRIINEAESLNKEKQAYEQ